MIHLAVLAGVLAGGLVQAGTGAAGIRHPPCPDASDTIFAGVTYHLEERARDGAFPVCPARRAPVDANADLALTFVTPVTGDSATATAEQERVLAVLTRLEEIGREVSQLNLEKVDLADSAGIRRFQAAVIQARQRVNGLMQDLKSLGLSSDDAVRLINQPGDAYVNLAVWLRDRIAALQQATAAFVESRDSVVVQVMAYRDPPNGKRVQLHVENYDELPLGELRPIDRYGLNLTPAEKERLRTELEGNQQIAGAIRRIASNADSLRRELRTLATRITDQLDQLVRVLGDIAQWSSRAAGLRDKLDELASGRTAAAANLRSLRGQLDSLRGAFAPVDSLVARVGRLRTMVSTPGATGFANLVVGQDGVVDLLGGIQANLLETPQQLESVRRHLDRARTALVALPAALVAEIEGPADLDGLDRLIELARSRNLVAADTALQVIRDVLELVGGRIIGADVLEEAAGGTPHTLDDLPAAIVELERAGWTLGDRVTVVVRFSQRGGAATGTPGRVLHETNYRLDAVLMGGHRELSSAVIFARAVTGDTDQRKWKPNVAALVSWHHYFREPKSGFKRAWNAFDPALGLHLANLDQSDDNVEFGLGLNLTLWRGLFSGGYGYNMSREASGSYWFVGLNLFDILSRSLQ